MNMDAPRYLDLHGARVRYWDVGTGPETLLLIHGMSSNAEGWQDLLPLLADKYRVIAPDLLDRGARGDYSLGTLATWLRDLLDALGIRHATVVGQSLGGGIAMQFAHQHRERCDRVIIIGGGVDPDMGWMLPLLLAPGAEFVLPVLAPRPVRAAGQTVRGLLSAAGMRSPRAAHLWSTFCTLSQTRSRQALLGTLRSATDHGSHSVDALGRQPLSAQLPVLLIWGENDRVLPVTHGHDAHRALASSRLEVLPGVGHLPHREAAAEVADIIDGFLATTRRRSVLVTRC